MEYLIKSFYSTPQNNAVLAWEAFFVFMTCGMLMFIILARSASYTRYRSGIRMRFSSSRSQNTNIIQAGLQSALLRMARLADKSVRTDQTRRNLVDLHVLASDFVENYARSVTDRERNKNIVCIQGLPDNIFTLTITAGARVGRDLPSCGTPDGGSWCLSRQKDCRLSCQRNIKCHLVCYTVALQIL